MILPFNIYLYAFIKGPVYNIKSAEAYGVSVLKHVEFR